MSCPLRVLCYNSLSSGFYPMRNNRDHIVGQLTNLLYAHMCTSLCLEDKSVVQLFRLAQYCVNPVFFMLLPSLNRMISPKVSSFSAFPTSVNCGFVGVSFYQAGFLWLCQHTMCAYLCTYNILASCIYYIFVFIWSGDKLGLMDFWSKVCAAAVEKLLQADVMSMQSFASVYFHSKNTFHPHF